MRPRRGQALIELALALPLILLIVLGTVEISFALIAVAKQDRATSTLAQYAALHDDDSWHAVAERELRGCDVMISQVLPDLVKVEVSCPYQPKVFPGWTGLRISSSEIAPRVPAPSPPAPASLAPSGSSS
jgi:hypothetical protein